jgi:hypothetical protein
VQLYDNIPSETNDLVQNQLVMRIRLRRTMIPFSVNSAIINARFGHGCGIHHSSAAFFVTDCNN